LQFYALNLVPFASVNASSVGGYLSGNLGEYLSESNCWMHAGDYDALWFFQAAKPRMAGL